MKKLLVILGFILSILAVILSVTPFYKLSILPLILGVICGVILFIISRKKQFETKAVQYIFLLSLISLTFIIYKSIFVEAKVGDIEQLDKLEDTSEKEAIKELEGIDIDS